MTFFVQDLMTKIRIQLSHCRHPATPRLRRTGREATLDAVAIQSSTFGWSRWWAHRDWIPLRSFGASARQVAAPLKGLAMTIMVGTVLLTVAAASPAHAATWTGATSTDWFNAGNWTGGVPITTTDGIINTLTNAPVITSTGAADRYTYVGNTATGSLTISSGGTLTTSLRGIIGNGAGISGQVFVTGTGSIWTMADELHVSDSGIGNLTISNAGYVSDTLGIIGYVSGSSGTVTVTGAGTQWVNSTNLLVGRSGTGTLTIENGGVVSDIYANIGSNAGSTGSVIVNGASSIWTNSLDLGVGSSGIGSLMISNGGAVSSLAGRIGSNSGSTGTATVTGAGSTWTNSSLLLIAATGTGTLRIADGGVVSSTGVTIAQNAGSVGKLIIGSASGVAASAAGSLSAPSVTFGSGTGSILFNHTDGCGSSGVNCGGVVGTDAAYTFASTITGNGTLTFAGGNTSLTASSTGFTGTTYIGGTATAGATMTLSGGADLSGNTAYIGNLAGETGTANVSGSGTTWVNSTGMRIGNYGSGALTILDAAHVTSTGNNTIGYNVGSTGTVMVTGTGSNWTSANSIYVGYFGAGILTALDGATVNAAGGLVVGTNTGSIGALTVSSGARVTSTGDSVVGHLAGSIGTAIVTGVGSSWSSASGFYVGNSGTGTLMVSDGATVSSVGALYVGTNTGSSGALIVSSGARVTNTGNSFMGYNAGSVGTATIGGAGSSWSSASSFYVGYSGSGTLTVSDGATVSSLASLYVGTNTGSSGALTVSSGARVTSTSSSFIGYSAGSAGTATVIGTGSSWSSGSYFYVGYSGTGALMVSDGGTVSSVAGLFVGTITGSSGMLTISGAGRVTSTGNSSIGNSAGATGTATVTGTGSSWSSANNFYIGNSGTGTLTIADGGVVSSTATAYIAANAGSHGSLIIGSASGSAASAAGTLTTPTVTFGAGTGSILFNHTNGCGSAGAACNGTAGSATGLTFSSAISGAGAITALSGVTYLTGNLSAFTGTTTVSEAARLFLNGAYGGDLSVDSGADAAINAAVGGDVSVADATLDINAAIGGSLILAGSSTAILSSGTVGGDVTVGAGSTFADNSTVSGNVDVNSGGTLKGSGTIGGDANVASGARVAPGNSIGTLNVVGDVNFAAGSFYDVEVNAAGASDKIIATGAANITGGTVNILPEAGGTFGVGTTYTILTAAGGSNGTFDAVTLNTSALFLDAGLSYDATNVFATLSRNATAFASVAATPNQRSVAAALDTLPVNTLSNAIAGQTSSSNAQATYRALTGELHAGIKGSLMEEGFRAQESGFRGTDKGVWATANGDWSERNGDNANTHAFTHKTKGIAFGYEAPAAGWLSQNKLLDTVGVAFSYGRSDYDLSTQADNSANGNADHYKLAAYGSKTLGPVTLRTSGQYGLHMIDTDRTVAFTGYTSRERADYHAQTLGGQAEAAYRIQGSGVRGQEESGAYSIEPFAQIHYGLTQISRFTETGGAASLSADSDLASQGSTLMGLRIEHQLRLSGVPFNTQPTTTQAACNDGILTSGGIPCALLKAQLGWKHLIGSANPNGTYSFNGSQSFTTAAAAAARDAFTLNLGFDVPLTNQAALNVAYTGAHAPEASSNALRGGVSWRW